VTASIVASELPGGKANDARLFVDALIDRVSRPLDGVLIDVRWWR
jgi:hypothetical protein